jgi:hypothetical protein
LTEETTTNTKDKSAFLATARDRFAEAEAAEREVREEARIDLRFLAGDQWEEKVKNDRKREGRPALVFNKLPTFVQSVANEVRQNKPQPKVNPVSGGATAETAKVYNGLIRHIQYRSKADVAYDTALEYAAACGFGYFRFLTEYCELDSDDQEIKVEPCLDPFAIYGVMVPAALGKPCPWAFVINRMSRDEFKREYPKAEATSLNFVGDAFGNAGDAWFGNDDVLVAEYWYIDYVERKSLAPSGRTVMQPRVKFAVINGIEVLEETDWAGDSIPIEAVLGKQSIVDGKIKLFSLVRFLRDPQQLFNFYKSGIAERVSLGNRVPYVGYEGQFTDPKWKDANVRNYPYLEAKAVMVNGAPAPLPQRQNIEVEIQGLSIAAGQESDDMKAIAGIFDASLGAKSNETSGVAQARRAQQSAITNLHFSDNLNRAEWNGCLKLIQLIPLIYDKPGRQARIIGEDEAHSLVTLNQPYQDEETGANKHYPLNVGKYDVVVTTGPSFTTARQEGADTLAQIFHAVPETFQILGDLWVGNMDYTWAEEGSRRLKAMLPPQVQNSDQGQMKIPPQVQAQMQQQGEMIQQLTGVVHQQAAEIEGKHFELASRERIVALQEQTKKEIAIAQLDQEQGLKILAHDLAAVKHQLDLQAAQRAQQADQEHAAQSQQADQDAAAQSQQADQEHAAGLQQSAQDAAAAQQEPQGNE